MRRATTAVLLLALATPLASCSDDDGTLVLEAAGPSSGLEIEYGGCYYSGPTPPTTEECKALSAKSEHDRACSGRLDTLVGGPTPAYTTVPTPRPSDCPPPPTLPSYAPAPPRPSPDTLESASTRLSDSGGEVTLVKGLSPRQVLAVMVPGAQPRAITEVCDGYGQPQRARTLPPLPAPTGPGLPVPTRTPFETCLSAQSVGGWTVVFGPSDLTVGLGPAGLLARLSADGREVVHVADHFEADAPFVVARNGKVVRTFDFCSEGSADDGAPLPEEEGLPIQACEFERFELVRKLTGIRVTERLLTTGDRVAVVTSI